jgi:S1-C subfamily serine protease
MYIPNFSLVRVLVLAAVVLSSSVFGQNIYVLEATAELSSVEITTSSATGRGVLLEDGATIATCAHVVEGNKRVDLSFRTRHERGYVVSISEENDIAIIKIRSKGTPFRIDRSGVDRIKGEFVVAAGKSSHLSRPDMRVGAVMAYLKDGSSNMLISSKTECGFSGGPVMDQNGYLIGITKGELSTSKLGSGTQVIPMWKILEVIHKARHGDTSTYLRPVHVPIIEIPQLPELDRWTKR